VRIGKRIGVHGCEHDSGMEQTAEDKSRFQSRNEEEVNPQMDADEF
jgi:hypothetical protein